MPMPFVRSEFRRNMWPYCVRSLLFPSLAWNLHKIIWQSSRSSFVCLFSSVLYQYTHAIHFTPFWLWADESILDFRKFKHHQNTLCPSTVTVLPLSFPFSLTRFLSHSHSVRLALSFCLDFSHHVSVCLFAYWCFVHFGRLNFPRVERKKCVSHAHLSHRTFLHFLSFFVVWII